MNIVNSFVMDMFPPTGGGWAPGPQQQVLHCHSREIQTSVHLLLPGEMGKHAVSEATNMVIKYTSGT